MYRARLNMHALSTNKYRFYTGTFFSAENVCEYRKNVKKRDTDILGLSIFNGKLVYVKHFFSQRHRWFTKSFQTFVPIFKFVLSRNVFTKNNEKRRLKYFQIYQDTKFWIYTDSRKYSNGSILIDFMNILCVLLP